MRAPHTISPQTARRAAVRAQRLTSPRPTDVVQTIRDLWMLQMDPTSSVARTEHLVLFARLGRRYRPAQLERALWDDRTLFEYRAFILPVSDLAIHRETMRRYPPTDSTYTRHAWIRRFLAENAPFRRHILQRLQNEGPLRTRDIEDLTKLEWRTGGWNDGGGSVSMMLEVLWARGEVMIVAREGQQRVWDLAERRLPMDVPPMTPSALAREVVERQLRAAGIARVNSIGWLFDGLKPRGWERALDRLIRDGVAEPVRIEGVRGDWLAHAPSLEGPFRGRTALLSPFDRLIHDRSRTEALFDFSYRLEIYVPPAKRRYGYYVLPILRGDRLIGRLDPTWDRRARVLRVRAVWSEEDAPADAGQDVRRAIDEMGAWLGATNVEVGAEVPRAWRRALRG